MSKLIVLFSVFLGAGFGGVTRVCLDSFIQRMVKTGGFSLGIVCVNILGCFLLGVLWGILDKNHMSSSSWVMPLLSAGFLGGFTTFSTFSYQSLMLLKEGRVLCALSYILISVVGGILLTGIGYWWGHR